MIRAKHRSIPQFGYQKASLILVFMILICALFIVPISAESPDAVLATQLNSATQQSLSRDVVLVLDVSGSMSNEPITTLKNVAKIFIDDISEASGDNRVAIVTFASDAQTLIGFTNDWEALNSSINGLSAGGLTELAKGLSKADSLLEQSNADIKNIVVLSDGYPESQESKDPAGDVYSLAPSLKAKYNIYTIGFFHSSTKGRDLLKNLQNKVYYEVTTTDVSDLKFVFDEVAKELTAPLLKVHIPGNDDQNISIDEQTINIESPITFTLATDSYIGNETMLFFKNPDGSSSCEFGSVTYTDIPITNTIIDLGTTRDLAIPGEYTVYAAIFEKGTLNEIARSSEINFTVEANPIIVVPGIMASKLYSTNSNGDAYLMWPPDLKTVFPNWDISDFNSLLTTLMNLGFDPSPTNNAFALVELAKLGDVFEYPDYSLKNNLQLGSSYSKNQNKEIYKEYGAQDTYKGLMDNLSSQFPNREIYFFSYDWRQPNTDTADKLNEYIDTICRNSKSDEVELIAHSMGGLVVSKYVEIYGYNKVNNIITIATPYEGAPKLLVSTLTQSVLENPATTTNIFANVKDRITDSVLIHIMTKPIKASYQSVTDLAPTKEYVSFYQSIAVGVSYGYRLFARTQSPADYSSYESVVKTIFGSGKYTAAENLHSSIHSSSTGVELGEYENAYFVFGDGKPTIYAVSFNDGTTFDDIDIDHIFPSNRGDGTVPYLSATSMNKLLSLSISDTRRLTVTATHDGILSHYNTIAFVNAIIRNNTKLCDVEYSNTELEAIQDDVPDYKGYKVIRIACPVDVVIEGDGDRLSSSPDNLRLSSSFGTLEIFGANGDKKYLMLDEDIDYSITLEGTDNGTMNYSVSNYNANNEETASKSFEDVPITKDVIITTNTTDAEKPVVLNIDGDGDGTVNSQWSVDETNNVIKTEITPVPVTPTPSLHLTDDGSDTGSGHYTEYPRTVSDGGIVSFGSSKVVTSVNLPKGSNGQVLLSLDSKQAAPSGKKTYLIFDISVTTYPSGETAEISFKIQQSELTSNGYSAEDVCLYHYVEGKWAALPTEYHIGSDGYVYYTAKTTSFSPFAIVFEEGAAVSGDSKTVPTQTATAAPSPVVTTAAPSPVVTTAAPAAPTAATPAPTQTKSPIGLAGLMTGLLCAGILIRRK